ncbi:MAG: hypothetical protein AAGJ31_16070 [Verrucomicrobiota bacterium]
MNVSSLLPHRRSRRQARGYSLPDVLIATTILAVGVMAATSLSLSMATQEDITWRTSRLGSLTENAAALYGMGLDPSEIASILPTDPYVSMVLGAENTETLGTNFSLRYMDIQATVNTVDDVGSWSAGYWTGGGDGAAPRQRTFSLRAYRSSHQLRNDQ